MKTFQLNAEPRTDLGKKAAKAIRKENKIPVVLNGGKLIQFAKNEAGEWICNEKLEAGQKAVLTTNEGKGVITTDLTVTKADVRKLIYTPEIYVIELNINGTACKAVLKDIQFHPLTDEILVELKFANLKGLYNNIPERWVLAVTDINIGQSIKVGKLQFDNFELVSAKDLVIAGVRATRGSAAKAQTEDAE